jgi:hypothetical protein
MHFGSNSARGGHGFGLTQAGKLPIGDWAEHLVTWLRRLAAVD